MAVIWKVIITIFVLYTVAIDANRARRRRRQTMLNSAQQPANLNPQASAFNAQSDARQQLLQPNPQGQQPMGQAGMGISKDGNLGQNQAGRQYGYGSQGLGYNSYGGMGMGNPYGSGMYSQYGQGMGQYGQGMGQYGSYYNQYPGSGGSYGGYGSGGYGSGGYGSGSYYNRPGYQSGGYMPGGSSMYGGAGGYYWNGGQKQCVSIFTILLSSLLALSIVFIFV